MMLLNVLKTLGIINRTFVNGSVYWHIGVLLSSAGLLTAWSFDFFIICDFCLSIILAVADRQSTGKDRISY